MGVHRRRHLLSLRVVAVGRFDGVHLGHQALLAAGRELAERHRLLLSVYTFPSSPPALLPTPAKERLLRRVADEVVLTGWHEIRDLDPEDFLRRELAGRLQARAVVMGADHRFGRDRGGDPELAHRLAPELGVEVLVVPALEIAGLPVRARRVRELVRAGKVTQASALLGRPPTLWGTPTTGVGLARGLGYPTINIEPMPELVLPAHGVYAAWMFYPAGSAPALFYIGERPTFPELPASAELHLLTSPPAPPGGLLEVHLLAHLRRDERFSNPDSLKEQIRRDVKLAEERLARAEVPVPILATPV